MARLTSFCGSRRRYSFLLNWLVCSDFRVFEESLANGSLLLGFPYLAAGTGPTVATVDGWRVTKVIWVVFCSFFFCRGRQLVTFGDLVELVIFVGNVSDKTEMSLTINTVKLEDPLSRLRERYKYEASYIRGYIFEEMCTRSTIK